MKSKMRVTSEMIEHLSPMQQAFAKWMIMTGELKIVDCANQPKPAQPTIHSLENNTTGVVCL